MKKLFLTTLVLCVICQVSISQSLKRFGYTEKRNDSIFVVNNGRYYIANQKVVTVKWKSETKEIKRNITIIRSNELGYTDILVPDDIDFREYVSSLENTGYFDIVEYNGMGEYCVITNDPSCNNQWYLNSIRAFDSWDITMGDSNTIVVIIDSGTDWTHSDIGKGTDNYKNINERAGWDYISNTNNTITNNGHGTRVAGIVGAKTNNSKGISGISGGNNSSGITMISFCIGANAPDGSVLDDAIIDAVNLGAKVIQLSLTVPPTNAINAAIDYAINHNVMIICASGNGHSSTVAYPASNHKVLAVGATNRNNQRASFSNYGALLSVVAPGVDIFSTSLNNSYNSQNGTSFSAPIVSGISALILSANPNLTGQEVRDIIEKTAQKVRPDLYRYNSDQSHSNGTWNNEMGYGLVDAYAAVQMAKALSSPADLYIRDTISDVGNTNSGVLKAWASPDIWIEDMDGNKVDPSEDKDYNICVRIHNKSDYPSSINDTLILNWTKAGVDLWWNRSWLGQEPLRCGESDIILGGFYYIKSGYIGNMEGIAVPDIPPHSSKVFKVKWHFPKPGYYSECFKDEQLWHYCLLARVHDGNPIWKEDESNMSVSEFVKNNENVAWRNITFLQGKLNKSTVSVGNPFKEPRTFSLSYSLRKNELGELLNKYADIYLNMSSNLFELWQKSDFAGKGFKVVDKNKILLTEPTATIERLVLQPEELYLLEAEVNFFTQEEPENNEFMFDIAEYIDNEKEGKELIGGETYIAIRNPERGSYFKAKALDDKTVLPAEPVSFRAEPISEDAVYTWFDQKGDTVAHGLNLTVTPTSTQHYKLEVVATADGFKDYDSVRATVRNGAIVSLSPNPTDNQLTITYRLAAGITNATIEISDVQNLSVQSYPVTAAATAKTVSLAGLTSGTYVVKLIINGETVDTRQVIKN